MKHKINTKYEILTPDGFKDFNGVQITKKEESIKFIFENGLDLECSINHKIDTPKGYIYSNDLEIGDIVLAKSDKTKIISKKYIKEDIDLFDLINVDDERHRFIANDIIISNCAFIDSNLWDDFYSSIYPTIASAKTSRVIIISTTNGMNHFYDIWLRAIHKESRYVPIEVNWWDVPTYGSIDYDIDDPEGMEFKDLSKNEIIYIHDTVKNDYEELEIEDFYDWLQGRGNLHLNQDQQYRIKIKDLYKNFYGINKKIDLNNDVIYNIIDIAWMEETIANQGYRKFSQEFENEFLTSADSLIGAEHLKDIVFKQPILLHKLLVYKELMSINPLLEKFVKIFEETKPGHEYVLGCDPAKITETSDGDSLAIQILDITEPPINQVCVVEIPTGIHYTDVHEIIASLGRYYNNAYVFIENNDQTGLLILDKLYRIEEYENIFSDYTGSIGAARVRNSTPGYRTEKRNRKANCLRLKNLIEKKKLILCDTRTIAQLSTFIKRTEKYEAEPGYKDDLVMSLIHACYFMKDDVLFDEFIGKIEKYKKSKYRTFVDKEEQRKLDDQKNGVKNEEREPVPITSMGDLDDLDNIDVFTYSD